MNVRATVAAPTATPLGAPSMTEAAVVALSPGLSVLFFDGGGARSRLSCSLDGAPLPPPFAATSLETRSGGRRHALLLGQGLPALLDRRVVLLLDGRPAALMDPDWLQPPVEDAPALLDGLTAPARLRLLRFLLATGAPLLGAGGAPLAEAARRLLHLCGAEPLAPVAQAGFGRAHRILTYQLSRGGADALDLVALWPARAAQIKAVGQAREAAGDGTLLHLHLPEPLPEGAEVVVLADPPLRLLAPAGDLPLRPLPAWLDGRGPGARSWALGRVAQAAATDAGAEALLAEMRGAAPPKVVPRHLSATAEGVGYALDLHDPDRLVRAVRIERGGRHVDVAPRLRVDGAGVLAGFAPLPGVPGEPCRVALLHRSGWLRHAVEVALPPYDGAVAPGFEAAAAEDAAAGLASDGPALALARARMTMARGPVRAQAQLFGAAPARVALSLVTEVGTDPDAFRARAALLWGETGAASAEVVCVAAEGDEARAARRLAAEAAAVFGVAHKVVAVPPDAHPAERLRAGLAHARGAALLLAPDVLPAQAGWLADWRRRLSRRGAAPVLGRVLRLDGSAEEAGLAPADCVGMTRAGIDRVLASAVPCPDPAVLLAELGAPARRPSLFAFVRYGLTPRLSPFEAAVRACALRLLAGDAP